MNDKSYRMSEEKWYSFWEKEGFFKPRTSFQPPFTLIIPPPNVTGLLHMGHALVNTLQDILVRWKRMLGFEVLWVPGLDHAGIATQTVVERELMKRFGKRRVDFHREKFLAYVWKWKESNEEQMIAQLKKLGCSCDWSQLVFTMDASHSKVVQIVFKKMFDEGLIYRGDYLVNWDPVTETALADDEVEYEEREGFLYYIKYFFPDSEEYLTIATVRPETLLGDMAVAISPEDPRYRKWIGKFIRVPLINRLVPVISDPLVDPTFGTGVVKVTPAHDFDDYAIAQRHQLPLLKIMNPDGRINKEGGKFAGMTMEEGRQEISKELQVNGLLEKCEGYKRRVGVSYRSRAIIEPYLSKQWFLSMTPFKKRLIHLVESRKVRLIPSSFKEIYFHWIDTLRDWCISRQLWWGHRIPIWYHHQDPDRVICYIEEGLPPEVQNNPAEWVQEEDVLDTWFSSSLCPFSFLGWPDDKKKFDRLYPTATLITGHDILFFWVVRMMVMGEYLVQKPPFCEVFLHGLIFSKSYWRCNPDGSISYLSAEEKAKYDVESGSLPENIESRWEKMSKSKGNVIDPIEMIDVYGADATRMALAASTTHARQIDLDRRKVEEFRHFSNKIWNGARFVLKHLSSLQEKLGIHPQLFSLEDRWILCRLDQTIQKINDHFLSYSYDKAALEIYDFFWKEFCAYYVEMSKPFIFEKIGNSQERENKCALLFIVLSHAIRLLHPMAPFITEELFQMLKGQAISFQATAQQDPYIQASLRGLEAVSCMVAPYPKVISSSEWDAQVVSEFSLLQEFIQAVRHLRAEAKLAPGLPIQLHLIGEKESQLLFQSYERLLKEMLKIEKFFFAAQEPELPFSLFSFAGGVKLLLPLSSESGSQEKVRLMKQKEKLMEEERNLDLQLGNPGLLAKAPREFVDKLRLKLHQVKKHRVEIETTLAKWL